MMSLALGTFKSANNFADNRPLIENPDQAMMATPRPVAESVFSKQEIFEWYSCDKISLAERKRISALIESFPDAQSDDHSAVSSKMHSISSQDGGAVPMGLSMGLMGVGGDGMTNANNEGKEEKKNMEDLTKEFVRNCALEKDAARARKFSWEYRTLEAIHWMTTKSDEPGNHNMHHKWDLFPFGSILVYACVRWLDGVGGYHTMASIQKKAHRPHMVLKVLQSFTGYGEGDTQIRSLDDIPDLEIYDVMHAIRQYLMFVRQDSIIPQCLLKHFIDMRRHMDSLKKLMSTSYLTHECRATLQAFLRHAFKYYNYARWPENMNKSTLEYFAQCMTWTTPDNTNKKDYDEFLRNFGPLLRSMMFSTMEVEHH